LTLAKIYLRVLYLSTRSKNNELNISLFCLKRLKMVEFHNN